MPYESVTRCKAGPPSSAKMKRCKINQFLTTQSRMRERMVTQQQIVQKYWVSFPVLNWAKFWDVRKTGLNSVTRALCMALQFHRFLRFVRWQGFFFESTLFLLFATADKVNRRESRSTSKNNSALQFKLYVQRLQVQRKRLCAVSEALAETIFSNDKIFHRHPAVSTLKNLRANTLCYCGEVYQTCV